LPSVEGYPDELSASAGSLCMCLSIDGRIRGINIYHMRPDWVVLDDIETAESVRSDDQTDYRRLAIDNDVRGLRGQTEAISQFFLCTIQAKECLSAEYTDPAQRPDWRGVRYRFLIEPPVNAEMWAEYMQMRQDVENEGPEAATAFYVANRAKMDEGAIVSWEHGYVKGREHSAVQRFYNDWADGKEHGLRYVACELQNDPSLLVDEEEQRLTPAMVCGKINNLKRREIPAQVELITAFIDVHKDLLYWGVCGWIPDFTGYVLDYGIFPPGRGHTLGSVYDQMSIEGAIRAGLETMEDMLFEEIAWVRDDGARLPMTRMLVDRGWETQIVKQFSRECRHYGQVLASHGIPLRAGQVFNKFKPRQGEKRGQGWRIGTGRDGNVKLRVLDFDANFFKSFLQRRFLTPRGQSGCLTLFGRKPAMHADLADGVCAEWPVQVWTKTKGLEDQWRRRRGREPHWLDVLAGNCLAAATCGIKLRESANAVARKPRRRAPRATYTEV